MDARRRTTLMQDGPAGNAIPSGIPVPSSTIKKNALRAPAARMSMAPTAMHGGSQPNRGSAMGAGMSHSASQDTLRRSTINQQSQMGTGRPQARTDGGYIGQTPQSNRNMNGMTSVRRQSTFPSISRQSMPPSSGSAMREGRPVKTQAFQAACRENIETFCRAQRCPIPINDRVLVSPTQKDFFQIFRWLISEFLDPYYMWSTKNQVEDILKILGDLRYPSLSDISKTSLGAPGSAANWAMLLAMLNWLVDLAKAHENWLNPNVIGDPLLGNAADLPLDHPLLEDRLLWDYISKMYRQWFRGEGEDFPEVLAELQDAYDRIQQNSVEESDRLETILQTRNVELQQLQAQEPPLKTLEEEYVRLMSDKTKFIAFIDLHRQKLDKIKQGSAKAKAVIADHGTSEPVAELTAEHQLDVARSELASIERAVSAQNLSPDEVQRMNHERETLSRQQEDLRTKIAEASQQAYDQEMSVTRSMDRFEQLLADYTALGHQIGTIPPVSEGPMLGPDGVDYSIDLDLGVEDVNEVAQAGRRLGSELRAALHSYGEGFRRDRVEIENANIALDDENDRLGQKVERQKEEAANLDMRLKVVNDQAEHAKTQLQVETSSANTRISRMENEVAQVLKDTQKGVVDLKGDIETKRIGFNELRHKTGNLQESIQKEITSHIDTIIRAKEHASAQLRGIRAIAESH